MNRTIRCSCYSTCAVNGGGRGGGVGEWMVPVTNDATAMLKVPAHDEGEGLG